MQIKNCRLESSSLFYYRGFLPYKDWYNKKSNKQSLTNYPEANNWKVRIATKVYFQLILNLSGWHNVSPVTLAFKMVCEMNVLVFFGEDFGKYFIFSRLFEMMLNPLSKPPSTCESATVLLARCSCYRSSTAIYSDTPRPVGCITSFHFQADLI